jgi:hypothetical protein
MTCRDTTPKPEHANRLWLALAYGWVLSLKGSSHSLVRSKG